MPHSQKTRVVFPLRQHCSRCSKHFAVNHVLNTSERDEARLFVPKRFGHTPICAVFEWTQSKATDEPDAEEREYFPVNPNAKSKLGKYKSDKKGR